MPSFKKSQRWRTRGGRDCCIMQSWVSPGVVRITHASMRRRKHGPTGRQVDLDRFPSSCTPVTEHPITRCLRLDATAARGGAALFLSRLDRSGHHHLGARGSRRSPHLITGPWFARLFHQYRCDANQPRSTSGPRRPCTRQPRSSVLAVARRRVLPKSSSCIPSCLLITIHAYYLHESKSLSACN